VVIKEISVLLHLRAADQIEIENVTEITETVIEIPKIETKTNLEADQISSPHRKVADIAPDPDHQEDTLLLLIGADASTLNHVRLRQEKKEREVACGTSLQAWQVQQ